MKVELYAHQQKAVDELANGKILRGDPGVGKSITALAYFYTKECGGVLNDWGSLRNPKDIYIITTAKKRDEGDWQRDAYYLGLMENREISVENIKVTVDSWNNIEKYLEVKDAFFIFDESKVVGSGLWAKTFLKITKSNRWILLSATPGDVWMDYASVFIANGFYKNRTEFKTEHVEYDPWVKFPKVKRYRQLGRLVRNRNAILVEMHYKRHTTRHLEVVVVAHNEEELERVTKKRWHVYESRPLRDVAELFAVSRKVVNSDPSRISKIQELQKKHKRIIVFYNFDYELELLRTLGHVEESTPTFVSPKGAMEKVVELRTTSEDGSTSTDSVKNSVSPMSLSNSDRTEPNSATCNTTGCDISKPISILATPSATGREGRPRTIFWELSPTPDTHSSEKRSRITEMTGASSVGWGSTVDSVTSQTDPSIGSSMPLPKPSEPSTDGSKPTHHPEAQFGNRKLYDLPSKPLPAATRNAVTRLLSGPTWSLADLQSLSAKSSAKSSSSSDLLSINAVGPKASKKLGKPGTDSTNETLPNEKLLTDSPHGSSGGVTVAEWNGHKHQPVPTTDEWIYLVQYMAGSEAWNCTDTDAMAFYSMTYSYKQFEQAQGRIDRLNTPFSDLWYYVFKSESWIDKAIKKALDMKQDFNEKRFRVYRDADIDLKEAS